LWKSEKSLFRDAHLGIPSADELIFMRAGFRRLQFSMDVGFRQGLILPKQEIASGELGDMNFF
jgi:hypothetical protein